MSRRVLVLALLLTLPLALPAATAERPTDGRCDATGRLVCAAANVGSQVSCIIAADDVASCSWTYGHIWEGFSSVGLPGEAAMAGSTVVTACGPSGCAVVTGEAHSGACVFVAFTPCGGGEPDAGTTGPVALALGQCLRVTIAQTLTVDAQVPTSAPTLATASWTTSGESAGAVCAVDDGRD